MADQLAIKYCAIRTNSPGVIAMLKVALTSLVGFLLCGCTHIQLRNNTSQQARTVSDMHTQQVLDNLAMFAYDPGSFPSFSTFRQGTSQVNDQGALALPLGLGRFTTAAIFGVATLGINPSIQRGAQEAWTIEPVNDPRKLELMRCAYQRAISACCASVHTSCPDCEKRFKAFYSGDFKGDVSKATNSGVTTSDCLTTDECWFGVGCKSCLPKRCNCAYVGRHCDLYVWVLPENRDELSKLTFAILDYATNEPKKPVQNLKEVTWFLDKSGKVTDNPNYAGKVVATVNANDPLKAILSAPQQFTKSELRALLKERNVTLEMLKTDGPFGIAEFTPDDRAKVIQLLAELKQAPAVALLEFLDSKSVSLKDVVEKKPSELGLSEDHTRELIGLIAQFKNKASFLESIQAFNIVPDELPAKVRKYGGGLESLDLQEERGLSPIFIPSGPSRSQADNILQLRQELNTVTMPQTLIP